MPGGQRPNPTGLPDDLKAGIENLSGIAIDEVRVNYNSPKPLELQALAYTQGTDIHVAPGQEQHLPHEAWHVVQQKQGRVKSTIQEKGLQINDDEELEREADVMGRKALQSNFNNSQASSSESSQTTKSSLISQLNSPIQPIQAVWMFYDGISLKDKAVFWLNAGDGDRRKAPPIPTAWKDFPEKPSSEIGDYYLPSQVKRPPRGKIPALTLEEFTAQYGKTSNRSSADVYNPFGRFDSQANITSFLPSFNFPKDRYEVLKSSLKEKDSSYQEVDSEGTKQLLNWITKQEKQKGNQISTLNVWGYPIAIITTAGKVLLFVSCSDLGATYSDTKPINSRALPNSLQVNQPSQLKWTNGVLASDEIKEANNAQITKSVIESWEGKDRELQQNQVMGMSAGEAVADAGFNPKEGKGWEWLHLIAHSMGGIEIIGPQRAENLVAGTSECNTQMIIVEEFLKDIVQKTDGRAQLHVIAEMYDQQRHIGNFIHYDFIVYDKSNSPITVYHWKFDCLSRSNPLVAENRELRYAGRAVFGVMDSADSSKRGYSFGQSSNPFTNGGNTRSPEDDKSSDLTNREIADLVRNLSEQRRSEIALAFGLQASQNSPQQIYDILAAQGQDVLFDVVLGSSVNVKDEKSVTQQVDATLNDWGMYRVSSDTTGFICLIDSIYKILQYHNININRELLIQKVRERTGRKEGQMLEIIGNEGQLVMQAVDEVVFATTGQHITLTAQVYIVMPNGHIVPFYNANSNNVRGAAYNIDLQLLFVNNNHYEPLFET